ncbi:MAG TPA: GNAT family N-acetyltransferase [Vicinamibacterales bacterium]|nr:GNAT family N-acetyltransferase [Vicinamibacterales bacterium]
MSYRIIRRTPDYDRAIVDLFGQVFGRDGAERFEARWAWQYMENPYNDADDPIHWIAVDDGGTLLGHISTMPFQMWWGDRDVRARSSLDQFVDPKARGRGVGVALVKAHIADIDLGLALGMTPSSYPIFKKFFTDIGPVPAYLRVLDGSALARRKWGPVAGTLAGPVVGLGLTLFSRRVPSADGVAVSEVASFTDDYTDLWARARASYASVVRRDRAYLQWKYERCPYHRYRVFEVRTRGTLSGFAVVRAEGEPAFRRGIIVDLFADTTDTAAHDALISAVVDTFRREGVARVETYCLHQAIGASFGRHGFRAGRTAMNYCIAACRSSVEPLARRFEHQLVLGDGDLDRA